MGNTGQKNLTTFALIAVAITAGYLFLNGSFSQTGTTVGAVLTILIAAQAARYYTNYAINHNFNALKWAVIAPLYFALVGFGVWAGCLFGTYLLNGLVKAAPNVSVVELAGGVVTRGMDYALIGLLVGAIWAIPTSLVLAFRQVAPQGKILNGNFTTWSNEAQKAA